MQQELFIAPWSLKSRRETYCSLSPTKQTVNCAEQGESVAKHSALGTESNLVGWASGFFYNALCIAAWHITTQDCLPHRKTHTLFFLLFLPIKSLPRSYPHTALLMKGLPPFWLLQILSQATQRSIEKGTLEFSNNAFLRKMYLPTSSTPSEQHAWCKKHMRFLGGRANPA